MIFCTLNIRDIDCERIVDWKTCLCGHLRKGEGEIKLKKEEWKCTHGPQLESARILEANDVFGCLFLSLLFFFLFEVLNVNIAFTAEQTKIITNIIKGNVSPCFSAENDWHF